MPPNPNELVIATRASGERLRASRTKSARSGGEDAGFSAVFVTVFVIVIVSSFIVSSSRDASRVRKCSVGGVSAWNNESAANAADGARRAEQMAYAPFVELTAISPSANLDPKASSSALHSPRHQRASRWRAR